MKNKLRRSKTFDIPLGRHLSISPLFPLMLLFSFWEGFGILFLITFCCALLHECSHILTARLLGVETSHIKLYPFGISASLGKEYIRSSEKEFWIAFSGPLCSFILFCVFSLLKSNKPAESLSLVCDANLMLCAVNLLPALPLDGGRMLKSILTIRFGIIKAYNLSLKVSRILISLLIVVSIAVFCLSKFNFSLILISAFLLQNLAFEKQSLSVITIREILSRKEAADNSENLSAKIFCINEDKPASLILKHLSYDHFCIIHTTNKDSAVTRTLTEVQVLNALTKKGVRTKFRDI